MKWIPTFYPFSEWLWLITTIAHDNIGVSASTIATVSREFLMVSPITRKHSRSVHF